MVVTIPRSKRRVQRTRECRYAAATARDDTQAETNLDGRAIQNGDVLERRSAITDSGQGAVATTCLPPTAVPGYAHEVMEMSALRHDFSGCPL